MKKEKGFWSDPDKIKEEIENFIDIHGIENFNFKYLLYNKYHSLNIGLRRYFDIVYSKYPELPRPQITTKPKNYYKNIENVLKDSKYLIEKYGCLPVTSREILKEEGMNTLRNVILKFGGIDKIYELLKIEKTLNISTLEKSCKKILDTYITNSPFIDNGRKCLFFHGIDLQNYKTKQWFQIDRFYINERVAIEIQGKQHYEKGGPGTLWTEEKSKKVKEIDEKKKEILIRSNVYLIEIPYTSASKKFILDALIKSNKFKIDNISC